MRFSAILTTLALVASTTLAAPAPEPIKPAKPPKPTPATNNQVNACGNNNQPYCCATDGKGKTSCSAMGAGNSICSTTVVCCNSEKSVQICLGNINVNVLNGGIF